MMKIKWEMNDKLSGLNGYINGKKVFSVIETGVPAKFTVITDVAGSRVFHTPWMVFDSLLGAVGFCQDFAEAEGMLKPAARVCLTDSFGEVLITNPNCFPLIADTESRLSLIHI